MTAPESVQVQFAADADAADDAAQLGRQTALKLQADAWARGWRMTPADVSSLIGEAFDTLGGTEAAKPAAKPA